MNIISHSNKYKIYLAPMAGITDKPFRDICRKMGAHVTVSEMISTNPALYQSKKTQLRMNHSDESTPRVIQIVGADPRMMADAAVFNISRGAEVIDINMGCPAKKVCNVMAGSSLLKDEKIVAAILSNVVERSTVPVTLKIRTGWNQDHKNALQIAYIAEQSGISLLTVHGRTRACGFKGNAEHDTVAEIKSHISIPVIANGDINSAEQALSIMLYTGADGIMIGRAAQGNPWIFTEINHYLMTGQLLARPSSQQIGRVLISHLRQIYDFYGEYTGVRIARKHIVWYGRNLPGFSLTRSLINREGRCDMQMRLVTDYFNHCEDEALAA